MSMVENAHYQGLSTLNQAIISAFRSDPEARLSFFETLLHHLPFSVVVFDYNHRYMYCNPAAIRNEEIRQWIIGKDDFEYCQYRSYDLQLAQMRRKHFIQALETQQPVEWEETFNSRENALIHQWRHIYPIFHQGQFQMAIGYGQDITKRKSMENELEKLNQELDSASRPARLILKR